MSAFKEAVRVGADGIELDVQLSLDGEVVVIHDETLNRTTNFVGYVKDFTAQELQQAIIENNERIPLLREVFEWVSSHDILINVELKTDRFAYEGIEEKVIGLILQYNLHDRVILSSFNHQSLEIAKRIAPEVERALLFKRIPFNFLKTLSLKREKGFHPKKSILSKRHCFEAQKLGYQVRPWTVNKKQEFLKLASYGVNAIMTDDPALATLWRTEIEKEG